MQEAADMVNEPYKKVDLPVENQTESDEVSRHIKQEKTEALHENSTTSEQSSMSNKSDS